MLLNSAGGIPDVKFLEDVAFYNALLRYDAKFRHSPNVKVFTSARNHGRTALGLSTQLNEWEIMGKNGDVYLVESAQTIEKRFTARGRLKKIWQEINKKLIDSVEFSRLPNCFVCSQVKIAIFCNLKNSETFGIFMEKINDEQIKNVIWNQEYPLVPVQDAIGRFAKKT